MAAAGAALLQALLTIMIPAGIKPRIWNDLDGMESLLRGHAFHNGKWTHDPSQKAAVHGTGAVLLLLLTHPQATLAALPKAVSRCSYVQVVFVCYSCRSRFTYS